MTKQWEEFKEDLAVIFYKRLHIMEHAHTNQELNFFWINNKFVMIGQASHHYETGRPINKNQSYISGSFIHSWWFGLLVVIVLWLHLNHMHCIISICFIVIICVLTFLKYLKKYNYWHIRAMQFLVEEFIILRACHVFEFSRSTTYVCVLVFIKKNFCFIGIIAFFSVGLKFEKRTLRAYIRT